MVLIKRLSNLAALSIYQTDEDLMIKDLSLCLEHCDLKMFHLDILEILESLLQEEMEMLLGRLSRHRNLQVLALRTYCENKTVGVFCADLEEAQTRMTCWPELGALYLLESDEYWIEKFPLLRKLQILELMNFNFLPEGFDECIADSISTCHSLCSLDLRLNEDDGGDLLTPIANGCPLLRKLFVSFELPQAELTEDQFLESVRALPLLELLSIDIPFGMTTPALQDLSESCPRLKLLAMKRTQLYICTKPLLAVPPLSSLQVMEVGFICFDECHRFTPAGSSLKGVVREWKRIFPQIRQLPCPYDAADLKSDLENNSPTSTKASGDGGNPSSKSNHSGSIIANDLSSVSPRQLRKRFWQLLDYSPKEDASDLALRFNHKWQTDLEIELFGWPVVVMSAYDYPEEYYPSGLT